MGGLVGFKLSCQQPFDYHSSQRDKKNTEVDSWTTVFFYLLSPLEKCPKTRCAWGRAPTTHTWLPSFPNYALVRAA